MTTRIPVNTAIVDAIVSYYSMTTGDIESLVAQISAQLISTYRRVILQQLQLYKCQKLPSDPIDPQSQRWIEDKALKDARGIAVTFERELRNKVQSVYRNNPKSNRYAYMRALDSWLVTRSAYKGPSISLNTLTAARKYAKDEFRARNVKGGKYILVGPPPVCKICVRIKALGAVTYETTLRRPCPAHGNCPHDYEALTLGKVDCNEVWTG